MKVRPHFYTSVLAVVLAGALAAGAALEGTFERTLKVTGPVDLEVKTGSGNITVRPGAAGSVRVFGAIQVQRGWLEGAKAAEEKLRALQQDPPIAQQGNVITIGRIEDPELRRNISISYDITAPAETALRADTGSGDITAEGLRRAVKADTGSGNVRLARIDADVNADTGSGEIELESIQGNVSADTGSGNIRATGVTGSFRADTGSGDVIAELTAAPSADIDTGSGNVAVRGVRGTLRVGTGSGDIHAEGGLGGPWKLGAGSGNITVRLPAEAVFDLLADTSSGTVEVERPITLQGRIKPNRIQGKVGGGGQLLEIETGSGDIHIK